MWNSCSNRATALSLSSLWLWFLSASSVAVVFVSAYDVLIIGGTRFSGAYLWKELYDRGHAVTVYNRGKTPPKPVNGESPALFELRLQSANFLKGDRKDPRQLRSLIDPDGYDFVYDMNAREETDTRPLAELFRTSKSLKQYVFMSSAGVYLKSDEMPHRESDPVDPACRHRGKLDSEACLREVLPQKWCGFRPTYICGPQNYNPVERYFFERLDAGRPVCVPGHGQHLTGLGHVADLASAMANVCDHYLKTADRVYNVQNTRAITFDGIAVAAASVMELESLEIVHYEPRDYEFPPKSKAFPMRPQHFFTCVEQAKKDLNWEPKYDTVEKILLDSYENDFKHVKAAGGLKNDFVCDDIVLHAKNMERIVEV